MTIGRGDGQRADLTSRFIKFPQPIPVVLDRKEEEEQDGDQPTLGLDRRASPLVAFSTEATRPAEVIVAAHLRTKSRKSRADLDNESVPSYGRRRGVSLATIHFVIMRNSGQRHGKEHRPSGVANWWLESNHGE
ncbi:MAG TPA: hypothetical protein VHJ58_14220 [Vicinamibacterales bacterium]|nr:hypothetical protein [Vicinamibacterales bacterium]